MLAALNFLQPVIYFSLLGLVVAVMTALTGWALWNYLFGRRYIRKLVNKYLLKRRIAWVSLTAVMLCTAMVLVVISVMGGWLNMFRTAFHSMSGDIVVYRAGLNGFSNYEPMLEKIRALPTVEAAAPALKTFGLLNLNGYKNEGVQVVGIPIDEMSKVTDFHKSLYRQYTSYYEEDGKTLKNKDVPPPTRANFDLLHDVPYQAIRPKDKQATKRRGMILGAPLLNITKDKDGKLTRQPYLNELWCNLQVVPVAGGGVSSMDLEPVSNVYWVIDDSRTQLYQLDANTVYVPFDQLQRDLRMDAAPITYRDPDTGEEKQAIEPARCHEIDIKLKPGADRMAVLKQVEKIVQDIANPERLEQMNPVKTETWEKSQEQFLGAVENEKALVTFLFSLISLVAVFLIFCILYMIVVEKTRDIGIIKSVGATGQGIAAVFLAYGLAIGTVGAALGFGLAYAIIKNINAIHTAMGYFLGIQIWKPEVYSFDRIPSEMDPLTVVVILIVAVMSAVVGAVVPAVRAARLQPVEALRFE